jgi:hypothetical protein
MRTFSWSHGRRQQQDATAARETTNEMMARQQHRRCVRQVHDEQASLVSLKVWVISSMASVKM